MKAHKAHLIEEYQSQRIRGNDYSTVYLGSLQSVLQTSLEFVLQRRKLALEAKLMEEQIALAKLEQEKARAEIALANRDLDLKEVELQIKQKQLEILPEELKLKQAEVAIKQEQLKLLPIELQIKQAELDISREQLKKLPEEIAHLKAQTALIKQNTINATTQNDTMLREQCKLAAEYEVLVTQNLKGNAEIALLNQKKATEQAQTVATGVDPDSVIGRQKALYAAQTTGYQRNAEQEVAKLLAQTWMTRRTSDDATSANTTNKLDDATIGRAMNKLLTGINA